ncbi:MAG TPA: hypothetical protein VF221_15065, partial [Chloroflexota bacterium]
QAGKEMLAAAAVVGQRAPWGLLTAVAGQTDEAGLAGLEEASQGRLLVESAQGDYVFAHHVIREVVESDLGAARRAFLHGRAAEALESQPAGAAPGLLAYHYVRSGHEEKAAAYLERAGDAARERYANAAAAEHYRSALTHLASDADLTRVTLKLGVVLTAAGRYDEAVEVLERAAAHDRSAGDWNGEARDIALLGEVHFRRGTIREGLARVQAMLDSLPPSVQSGAAPLYVALARLGPRHDLLVSAQRAAEFARLGQDDGVLATAEALVGQGLLLSHRPQDALELYERLIPTYEAAGDLPSLCLSLTRCAHAHAALGAFDEARVDLERALAAAERIDDQPLVAEVLELIGWHAVIMGEWQAADEYIGRLEDVAHSLGTDRLPVTLLLLRGSLALFRGEWDQATQNFEEAERVTLRTNDPMWRAVQDKLAARDLATGHPEAALIRQAQPAMHLDTDEAWGRLVEHAEAHLAVGNLDRAEEIVAEALARFGSRDDRLRQSELLLVHGMLLARRERWEAAAAVFDEGISLSRGLPYPYLEARMLYQFGTMLVRQDDLEGAAWRLDDALKIFRRLGASKDVARVEQALEILKQAPSSNQAGAPREQAEREQAHSCNQRK